MCGVTSIGVRKTGTGREGVKERGERQARGQGEREQEGSNVQTSKVTVTGLPGNPGVKILYFPGGSAVKNLACQCRRCRFNPRSGKTPHVAEQLSSCSTAVEPVL